MSTQTEIMLGEEKAALELRLAEFERMNDALRRQQEELQQKVAELENANVDARKSRLATLNALEDATASRCLVEALNQKLQNEIAERKVVESALRESERQLKEALEIAKTAHRAKDQFIAALSHELRTPLAPILLAAGAAAQDDALPKKTRACFSMIKANVEVEARLIDDLLDQTQIEHGRTRLMKRPVDVHAVLEAALRTTAQEFADKQIQPVKDFRAAASFVEGDPVRLQQIFWNLLRNAAKFTPQGGRVTISTADGSDKGIVINVTDTGIGLTPMEKERIFQPFSQGDHANEESSKRFGGLGLGLSISQRLVDLHGGTLSASSAGRGLGTTFTVELASAGCAVPAEPESPSAEDNRSPFRHLRILLVEDHAPTRLVLENLLRRKGHEPTTAGSVSEAQHRLTDHPFDVVMSDLGLPDGTGWELMSEVQRIWPGMPAIALSGYGMENDLRKTKEAGFSMHLTKPVSIEQLDMALHTIEDQLARFGT
jgi:signal transduction histidine kinase/ActR/RegA family two-component response regulator